MFLMAHATSQRLVELRFKSVASSTLMDRTKADDLEHLFYLQEEKCYITGKKLIIGDNAGLDHLIPKSKNHNLISDINNVRWIDKKINEIKRDLTIDDFISLCKLVASRHKDI